MDSKQLITDIQNYVVNLFAKRLKVNYHFHCLAHTQNVVAAVEEIGSRCGLDQEEMTTVIAAAWFHDTGYTEVYNGHEAISVAISTNYLKSVKISNDFIMKVRGCILSTRIPQQPCTLLEKVICDADFYHLSKSDYSVYAMALKTEWETCLNLTYSDQQWNALNLEMLTTHEYFTDYGKTVLQQRKQKNIDYLLKIIERLD